MCHDCHCHCHNDFLDFRWLRAWASLFFHLITSIHVMLIFLELCIIIIIDFFTCFVKLPFWCQFLVHTFLLFCLFAKSVLMILELTCSFAGSFSFFFSSSLVYNMVFSIDWRILLWVIFFWFFFLSVSLFVMFAVHSSLGQSHWAELLRVFFRVWKCGSGLCWRRLSLDFGVWSLNSNSKKHGVLMLSICISLCATHSHQMCVDVEHLHFLVCHSFTPNVCWLEHFLTCHCSFIQAYVDVEHLSLIHTRV